MKFIGKIMILILIVSCSKKENNLEQYTNYPVKFAKHKISHSTNDFSIFIPKNWEWKIESYDTENIILGIDAAKVDKDGFTSIISIQKIKSFGDNKDLKSEFEYSLDIIKNNNPMGKLIDYGYSETINKKSYYIHSKSDTGTYGEAEIISFILESGIEGVFYNLTASVPQTEDLKKNMAVLISCLSTFENKK